MKTIAFVLTMVVSAQQTPTTGYAPVNGLKMYYEVHGSGEPVVLLHGAFMTIPNNWTGWIGELSKTRKVIAVEMQGHGRTADIERDFSYENLADDVPALLDHLKVPSADLVGYSMGGGVAMYVAVRHPELVRKLVYAGGASYDPDGFYPELLEGEKKMTPDAFVGTPWLKTYQRIAPNKGDWPKLVEKIKVLDLNWRGLSEDQLRSIKVPTMLIVGDADVVRPEHVVKMFRLLGGGVPGDLVALPRSRLAVLPGTTHVTLITRTNWLLSMIPEFLDAPVPGGK
jgi:pimeloyl-ACP methyl ester carboxylesterase